MRILTNPRILNEEYYGTNNELKNMENALASIKYKITQDGTKELSFDIGASEEYSVIKRSLCNVFGFKDVLLQAGMFNSGRAFTLPMHYSPTVFTKNFSDGSYTTKNQYGICFAKEAEAIPYVYIDLSMLSPRSVDLTPKELVGILLHEIGHNFFATNTKSNLIMSNFRLIRSLLATVVTAGSDEEAKRMMNRAINEMSITILGANPKLREMFGNVMGALNDKTKFLHIREIMSTLIHIFVMIKNEFISVIHVLMYLSVLGNFSQFLNNVILMDLISLATFGWVDTVFVGYDDEKFADNFATTYGYGPEMVSGLSKIVDYYSKGNSRLVRSIVDADPTGLSQFAINIYSIPISFFSYVLLDCHPTVEQRVLGQIKMLKTELKKTDLSTDAKKKILEDLERIEKVEDRYFNSQNDDTTFTKFRKFMSRSKKFYGGDVREILRGDVFKEESKEWSHFSKLVAGRKTQPVAIKPLKKK